MVTLWWTNITMERSTIFYGSIYYKWPFSIAMFNYQEGIYSIMVNDGYAWLIMIYDELYIVHHGYEWNYPSVIKHSNGKPPWRFEWTWSNWMVALPASHVWFPQGMTWNSDFSWTMWNPSWSVTRLHFHFLLGLLDVVRWCRASFSSLTTHFAWGERAFLCLRFFEMTCVWHLCRKPMLFTDFWGFLSFLSC